MQRRRVLRKLSVMNREDFAQHRRFKHDEMRQYRPLVYAIGGLAVLLYVSYTEMRISDNQVLNNFLFDTQSCAKLGEKRDMIEKCFSSRGYKTTFNTSGSLTVRPILFLQYFSIRVYSFEINFDPFGSMMKADLDSSVGAL